MKYIESSQLTTYLRLGRELPQYIGLGKYFEATTFEWVNLSGTPDKAKIALIRSYDEGDEWYCDVVSFAQVADDDPSEEKYFEGSVDECLHWLETELGGDREKFVGQGMIDDIYKQYVLGR